MRNNHAIYLILAVLVTITACTKHQIGSPDVSVFLKKDEMRNQAKETVVLALSFYDQGGYEKSAKLFLEAADLFKQMNDAEAAKRALIAAAKVQLKCNQRDKFLETAHRLEQLLPQRQMPNEDERFLINLACLMEGRPLPWPVKASWEVIF